MHDRFCVSTKNAGGSEMPKRFSVRNSRSCNAIIRGFKSELDRPEIRFSHAACGLRFVTVSFNGYHMLKGHVQTLAIKNETVSRSSVYCIKHPIKKPYYRTNWFPSRLTNPLIRLVGHAPANSKRCCAIGCCSQRRRDLMPGKTTTTTN